jgi:rod shape-determining protein MreD
MGSRTTVRRAVRIFAIGLILFLFQILLEFHLHPYPFLTPNLLLILVVYLGFFEVSPLGALLSFLLGIIFDLGTGTLLGPWAGSFVAVFTTLALLSQRIFVHSPLSSAASSFVSSLIANLSYSLLVQGVRKVGAGSVWDFVGEAFVTALVTPLLFAVLGKVSKERRRFRPAGVYR